MSKISKTKIAVLDQFEARTDAWTFRTFEKALSDAMGSYQTAKMTICDAHKEGKWPNVVKRYVLSNYKAFGNSPSELTDITRSLFANMSDDEKAAWKPAENAQSRSDLE